MAQKEWVNELRASRALSVGDAELRILELLQNNPKAHAKEMSRHTSRLRKNLAEVLKLEDVLHKNALDLLQWMRRQSVELIIFDECHHLTDYWAVIMSHLIQMLDDPVVVALTGTPPEGKTNSQNNRYSSLVGSIDYQVPTPALVREGGLAPFQDLVYFTEPTGHELEFLESQHEDFHELVQELIGSTDDTTRFSAELAENGSYDVIDKDGINSPLLTWILHRAVSAAENLGWSSFASKRQALADAICKCLWNFHLPFPKRVEYKSEYSQPPVLEDWMILLEDFASHKLKTDANNSSHVLYERIRAATRKLGYGLTERGLRKQASPADRVLAFSRSKAQAAADILAVEYRSLHDRLRAIVVTDFERMSATSLRPVKGVLTEDCGGAAGVLRTVVSSPIGAYVHPCLVTGSLLLIDNRIAEEFERAAVDFLAREGLDIDLEITEFEGDPYSQVTANSAKWDSKLYVRLSTELFERGITKCLIGTRGLFGEGWDSQALNTLVDLTTTTAPVSVKQLRGRSIRIQTSDPIGVNKVANNWDVVCIAPHLEKGLNDYDRFVRKHQGFFGIADDGQIEKGVGHVHPAFSEMTPAEVFNSYEQFNNEMVERALARPDIYDLWKIGTEYKNKTISCIEVDKTEKNATLTPPNLVSGVSHKQHARQIKENLKGVWIDYAAMGTLVTPAVALSLAGLSLPMALTALPALGILGLGLWRYRTLYESVKEKVMHGHSHEENILSLAAAVLAAMKRRRLLPHTISRDDITVSPRANGCYRVFLNNVSYNQSKQFSAALKELMTPASNQAFIVPRYEFKPETVEGDEKKALESRSRFFRKYLAGRARPSLAGYHPVPSILARSAKGREAFQDAWNKFVSPGEVIETEGESDKPNKKFQPGPALAQRLLWE